MLACGLQGCATRAEPGWQQDLRRAVRDQSSLFDSTQTTQQRSLAKQRSGVHVGDELLYGICLHVGDTRKIWYLKLEVLDLVVRRRLSFRKALAFEARVQPGEAQRAEQQASARARQAEIDARVDELGFFQALASDVKMAHIRVTAFDANGKTLGTAESEETAELLTTGLLPACQAGFAQRDLMRDRVALGPEAPMLELDSMQLADVQAAAHGVIACESFFATLRSNPVTKSILYEVIALPSLWSVITNLGVKVSFEADFFAADRVAPERLTNANRELWSVPCHLQLNGQPALLAHIVAGPSGSPDAAAAGIFAIVGQHPTDPQRRIHVQLLRSSRASWTDEL